MDVLEPILFSLFGLAILYVIYKSNVINTRNVEEIIKEYFDDKELRVLVVKNLSLKEKVHYGIPVISYNAFSSSFSFILGTYSANKKVDLVDVDQNEYTKYIEINITAKMLDSINEFDSYDI